MHPPRPSSLRSSAPMILAVLAGALVAAPVAVRWGPDMAASLIGSHAPGYWQLSRASGLISFVLLWLSVLAGLLISNRTTRWWPDARVALDVHRQAGFVGLGFALFHAMVLLADGHLRAGPVQVLVPFAFEPHARAWVALGQLALYGGVIVGSSRKLARRIGQRAWRVIHFGGFTVFAIALAHGALAGSDAGAPAVRALYIAAGASVLLLTVHRLLTARPR